MIRRLLKHFTEYPDALEYKEAHASPDKLQIRRKKVGFDVVFRQEGISKWSEVKAKKNPYTKAKKKRRNRRGSVQFGTYEQA